MEEQRYNFFLDELPKDWNGYRIDTDFRIGIQITQLMEYPGYSRIELLAYAAELLFLEMPETMEECLDGLKWFLTGWDYDRKSKGKKDVIVLDYDIDQWRIHAAFLAQYHIDLSRTEMHFWEFMGLMRNLEECHFTRVRDIRSIEITSDMSEKTKKAYKKAKEYWNINTENPDNPGKDLVSEARAEFLKLAGLG